MEIAELLGWYENKARPFIEKYANVQIARFENDYRRLKDLLSKTGEITICFLGNSGVGKSTLINAIVAGEKQILPSGGIGPLTAQAIEVHYSEIPSFSVRYQSQKHLWEIGFVLEQYLIKQEKDLNKKSSIPLEALSDEYKEILDNETIEKIENDIEDGINNEENGCKNTNLRDKYIKQARLIITNDQFSKCPLQYLVDAIRLACGLKTHWCIEINDEADLARIKKIKDVLALSKEKRIYFRRQDEDVKGFMKDLREHAAGFLSPLIEQIDVGWPSGTLKHGVKLVDLPGIGIARDVYRNVTKSFVQEKARAVILVVDRAGPTESTVDILQSSGYWSRLIGATDDPMSDPCTLLVAVTKVDDLAKEEWGYISADDTGVKPKRWEVFIGLLDKLKEKMRCQINEQLETIGTSENEVVNTARLLAKKSILENLQIFPVSAPELRNLLFDDEDSPPFLKNEGQTGIPQLRSSLCQLAEHERDTLNLQIDTTAERLYESLLGELKIIEGKWKEDKRASEEAERLRVTLEDFLKGKRMEYDRRVGAFRGFLTETVQEKIEKLVLEAKDEAKVETGRYLRFLKDLHWASLRAMIRRGGTYKRRELDVPNDIAAFFQEPMAAVWSQKLLKDIRKRTTEITEDIANMVVEICNWAYDNGGTQLNRELLELQQSRISSNASQMKQVGKEAIDELRKTVKTKVMDSIRKPIKNACDKFVKDGDDVGAGVKIRMHDLLDDLAERATKAALKPANDILKVNFTEVRTEIQQSFEQWGDPIQETSEMIVETHENRLKRSDAQKRNQILSELETVLQATQLGESETEIEEGAIAC